MIKLFGILNITPDSFSDGGMYMNPMDAIEQAQKLFDGGADVIDVGAQSTKPNAEEVSLDEEWNRLEPVLGLLIDTYPGQISLDTMKPEIAQRFVKRGGTIINDVSGFQNPKMIEVAVTMCNRSEKAFIVVNHFPGKTVDEVHEQKISSINQVVDELMKKKEILIRSGIPANSIILDPGIGFGKTMELNHELLAFAKHIPDERVLIGHSRKRFLGNDRFEKEINLQAGKRAIDAEAEFLRVHDVEGYKD